MTPTPEHSPLDTANLLRVATLMPMDPRFRQTVTDAATHLEDLHKQIAELRKAQSSIDHHQLTGLAHDIIQEALNSYREFMLDDAYDAQGVLDKIMSRISDRASLLDPKPEDREMFLAQREAQGMDRGQALKEWEGRQK